ncbi:MAG: DEAD/DEAH box helicase [Candidatus Thermoplasmatota archaeon]
MVKKQELLDLDVMKLLNDQGITTLYPPQQEALPYALEGKNLLLSIPTASGKSLIAYLAILHRLRREGGKALYIVPLRALAWEKYEDLQKFKSLGLKVALSTGDLDTSDTKLSRYDIIVCTSEKADSLLRHGIIWIDLIKVIVVDEIHLIHDPSRGPTLEVIIARFKALNPHIQLIGLSATIKNAVELADWLGGKLIQTTWRPVPLKEGVLFRDTIRFNNNSQVKIIGSSENSVELLVEEIVRNGGQVLVFVNNRKSTITTAQKLTNLIRPMLTQKELEQLKKLRKKLDTEETESTIVSQTLLSCVSSGVAFHNAGLSSAERRIIEQGFKDRIIKCIIATPTLAAGVNTPARRVIIRDLWRYDVNLGMTPIPILEYKQQAGRAGRPGYDEYGEAITIAKNKQQQDEIFYNYILADTEPIYSKLGTQSALRMHLLSAIATGFATDTTTIQKFINSTFYSYMSDTSTLTSEIDTALRFLSEHGFIAAHGHGYQATLFGTRTSSLYIDPLSAVQLKKALEFQGCRKKTPFSYLHAICSTPDLRSLYLRTTDSWIEEQIEHLTDQLLFDIPDPSSDEYEWFLSDIKTAFLLLDWIEEVPYDMLETKYNVWPGDIHNIVEVAQWLLHAMREFARSYNYDCVSQLNDLLLRVEKGIKQELINLISLRGIGRVRARALYNQGFKTINDLRGVPVERLAQVKTIGKTVAENIKKQLGEHNLQTNKTIDEDQV